MFGSVLRSQNQWLKTIGYFLKGFLVKKNSVLIVKTKHYSKLNACNYEISP